jgi:multidrug efflux system membrane fusion protein
MISKITDLEPVETKLQRTTEIDLQQTTEVKVEKPADLLQKAKVVHKPAQAPASERMLLPPPPKPRWWVRLAYYVFLAAAGTGIYFAWPHIYPHVKPWVDKYLPNKSAVVAKKERPPIPVVTAPVRQGDMEMHLNGLGTVTAFNTVTLRCRVDGELIKVLFTEGQMVQQGELLAEIDPRPYEAQLTQAEGQLAKDQAMLKVAQLDFDRYSSLAATKSITQQQLDQQTALVKQNQGAIKVDQGQIDNIKLQLNYCQITAPITGRIGLRLVDRGNIVRANDVNGLAVITQLQPIAVIFTIPQDDISAVQQQLRSGETLTVDAYDRDFNIKLAAGTLLAIDNQVDATTGTVKLKAVFKNEDNMLFPNQFVNARLGVSTMRNVIISPAAALQRGPDSTFVYLVKPDSTVELRKVEVGATEGDQSTILSGLSPGELVVTDGVDKLLPGAKVTVPAKGLAGKDGKKTAEGKPGTGGKQEMAERSGAKGS